jgi:UDP-N-acetylmuramate dehydrogenase
VSLRIAAEADLVWLSETFQDAYRSQVPLAPYTSSRLGGMADHMIEARSAQTLVFAARELWGRGLAFRVLGGGSNVLVADEGVREVVLLNRAKDRRFSEGGERPSLWAESGASIGTLARQSAERGLTGLEWAAGVPGTLGGAVVGNAGAHGGDMAGALTMAEILQQDGGQDSWPVERFEYGYRTSSLKRNPGSFVVLSATMDLMESTVEACKAAMRAYREQREASQPAGASMGSMFKNPIGQYAGQLLDSAGLKGMREGSAVISEVHANFFINEGGAKAADVRKLIGRAEAEVRRIHGIELELEIELIGDWPGEITGSEGSM